MATVTSTVPASVPSVRPVARWIQSVDDRGRCRLVMTWHVPDLDAELRAVVDEAG
jgi:hypothetical protein